MGKYYVETIVREYFDTKEDREHYVKEHVELPFDMKVALIEKGEAEQKLDITNEDVTLTAYLKEVND